MYEILFTVQSLIEFEKTHLNRYIYIFEINSIVNHAITDNSMMTSIEYRFEM